jgi:hypothetical protein
VTYDFRLDKNLSRWIGFDLQSVCEKLFVLLGVTEDNRVFDVTWKSEGDGKIVQLDGNEVQCRANIGTDARFDKIKKFREKLRENWTRQSDAT